jgi:hypothetical protein
MFESGFKIPLGGSIVRFEKRALSEPPSAEQKNLETERTDVMRAAFSVLRRMRGGIFKEASPEARQQILEDVHAFCDQFAEYMLEDALDKTADPEGHGFRLAVAAAKGRFNAIDPETKHSIPSSNTVYNLKNATEDMLARTEKIVESLDQPTHRLSEKETLQVLSEFLDGTNLLNSIQREKFFHEGSRHGGVLTGGMIELLVAKKIIERFGDEGLHINPFVIALSGDEKSFACETSDADSRAEHVFVLDDMIDKGETITAARDAAGSSFPNATVYANGISESPEARAQEMQKRHDHHLTMIFQDFADAVDEGDEATAESIYAQASQYAVQNGIKLKPGWDLSRARLKKKLAENK